MSGLTELLTIIRPIIIRIYCPLIGLTSVFFIITLFLNGSIYLTCHIFSAMSSLERVLPSQISQIMDLLFYFFLPFHVFWNNVGSKIIYLHGLFHFMDFLLQFSLPYYNSASTFPQFLAKVYFVVFFFLECENLCIVMFPEFSIKAYFS